MEILHRRFSKLSESNARLRLATEALANNLKLNDSLSYDNDLCAEQSYNLNNCSKGRACCTGSISPNSFAPYPGSVGDLFQSKLTVNELQQRFLESHRVVQTQYPIEMCEDLVMILLEMIGHWKCPLF